MKKLLTVNCEVPGGFGEHVSYTSNNSLLDGDVVLLDPNLRNQFSYAQQEYRGRPALSETESFRLKESMAHWRRDTIDTLEAGKTVFVLLTDYQEVYVKTGQETYSGADRNRVTTEYVTSVSNYDLLAVGTRIIQASGTEMVLNRGEYLLKEYWVRTAMCILPVSVVRGQITPWCTGA